MDLHLCLISFGIECVNRYKLLVVTIYYRTRDHGSSGVKTSTCYIRPWFLLGTVCRWHCYAWHRAYLLLRHSCWPTAHAQLLSLATVHISPFRAQTHCLRVAPPFNKVSQFIRHLTQFVGSPTDSVGVILANVVPVRWRC